MIYRRERPRCRKVIEILLREYDCSLQDLINNRFCFLSHGLRIQCRKMFDEGKFRSAKELRDFEAMVLRHRNMGLIK